jgi:rhodanese-related sulfurtransferase
MESAFCRFCQGDLQNSTKEVKCDSCGHASIPVSEEGMSISPKEVKKKLGSRADVLIVDVRWPDEVRAASIKGSLHIPLSQLERRMAELPKDKQLIMLCHTGNRSRFAAIMLLCSGFTDVKNLVGGIDAWSTDVDRGVPRY